MRRSLSLEFHRSSFKTCNNPDPTKEESLVEYPQVEYNQTIRTHIDEESFKFPLMKMPHVHVYKAAVYWQLLMASLVPLPCPHQAS